jgi:DNA mismatch repair ATPase MutS
VRVDGRDGALAEMLESGDFEVVAPGPIETELRVIPSPELEELRRTLEEADDALDAVEAEVVRALGEKLAPRLERLVELERWIGRLDFRAAKVTLAADWPAWPEPADDTSARNAWLPAARGRVVESGGRWQPVEVVLGSGVTLLTGPNMGGKTVALGILATVQFLGQLGYPAPAEAATFRWVDAVDYVGGELGSFTAGLSSFAGEIAALSAALVRPGVSLLLVDELGKGTSPGEGKAIAAAAARHLVGRGHSCMLVTHFARLAEDVACRRLRVRGLADVSDEDLRELAASHGWSAALNSAMDYRLVEDDGTHERSDALRIARLLGLPESIVDDAIAALEPDVDDR